VVDGLLVVWLFVELGFGLVDGLAGGALASTGFEASG